MSPSLFEGLLPAMTFWLVILLLDLPITLWLCPKMGARRWLWGVLCFIPVVNLLALPLLTLRALGAVLDRLNEGREDTA